MLRYSYLTVVLFFCAFTTTAQLADSVDIVINHVPDTLASSSVSDTSLISPIFDSTISKTTLFEDSISSPAVTTSTFGDTLHINSINADSIISADHPLLPTSDSSTQIEILNTSLIDTNQTIDTKEALTDSLTIITKDSLTKLIETIDSLENHIIKLEAKDSIDQFIASDSLELINETTIIEDSVINPNLVHNDTLHSQKNDSIIQSSVVKPDPIIIVEPLKNIEPDYDHEVTFSMRVVDSIAKTPVPAHVELHIIGKGYDEISSATCDQWGKFSIRMTSASQFEVVINAESFMTLRQHIDLSTETEFDGVIEKYFKLQPLKSGSIFVLNNMNFKQGDHELPKSCHEELNKLVTLLNANPKMVIKLGGHTDNTASLDASVRLSLKRVNEVRYYLIQKGIKLNRIKVQGYGSSRPLVGGTDPESQKKNRRVDCEILRF